MLLHTITHLCKSIRHLIARSIDIRQKFENTSNLLAEQDAAKKRQIKQLEHDMEQAAIAAEDKAREEKDALTRVYEDKLLRERKDMENASQANNQEQEKIHQERITNLEQEFASKLDSREAERLKVRREGGQQKKRCVKVDEIWPH